MAQRVWKQPQPKARREGKRGEGRGVNMEIIMATDTDAFLIEEIFALGHVWVRDQRRRCMLNGSSSSPMQWY